jgi:hypothetical protein
MIPFSGRHAVIFTGAFGSGKTEVAISYARALAAEGRAVSLLDCDIVTPYFRVGNYRDLLMAEGIRVVAAPGALAAFEVPAVSPELRGTLDDPTGQAVLDAGGDPVGAHFLAGYAEPLRAHGYDMWMVVNPHRPATAQPEAMVALAREIEARSGLAFTGLVANPNLGLLTQPDDLRRGLGLVAQAAAELGLPLVALAVGEHLTDAAASLGTPVLPLRLLLHLPWGES